MVNWQKNEFFTKFPEESMGLLRSGNAHNPPVISDRNRAFEGLGYSETCRLTIFKRSSFTTGKFVEPSELNRAERRTATPSFRD